MGLTLAQFMNLFPDTAAAHNGLNPQGVQTEMSYARVARVRIRTEERTRRFLIALYL